MSRFSILRLFEATWRERRRNFSKNTLTKWNKEFKINDVIENESVKWNVEDYDRRKRTWSLSNIRLFLSFLAWVESWLKNWYRTRTLDETSWCPMKSLSIKKIGVAEQIEREKVDRVPFLSHGNPTFSPNGDLIAPPFVLKSRVHQFCRWCFGVPTYKGTAS